MRDKFRKSSRLALSSRGNPASAFGLTLVELLVAISVLGFVAVLGWRGLDSIVRARISLTGELEQTRGMQLAFAQLQSDSAHMVDQTVFPYRIPIVIEQGRLTLVRTVYADNQPTRLQVIRYVVMDGKLTRRESAAMRDTEALEALLLSVDDAGMSEAVVLQSDVEAMQMRVWGNGGSGWRSSDDALSQFNRMAAPIVPKGQIPPPNMGTGLTHVFPTGLEVTLQLRGYDSSLQKIFLLGSV